MTPARQPTAPAAGDRSTSNDDEISGWSGPLSVRVLDLSDRLGAYCTKLLADLGADVIKAEPPAGDRLRRRPPLVRGPKGQTQSAVFAAYHANKRGITLDASRSDARPLLEALGHTCDVIVASPTAIRPIYGFDRDAPNLDWARRDAIVAAITPFGLTGPLRDVRMTPMLSFAMGGGMHWVGPEDGPPLPIPGQMAWDEAGIHAALGIISAVFARSRVGGQVLDLSVHEVAVAKDFLLERYDAGHPGEWGRKVSIGIPPTGVWECSDGPLAIACHQDYHWQAFLRMLDEPEALMNADFDRPLFRREVHDLLSDLIAPLMARHPRLTLFEKGQAVGLPCATYNTPRQFVSDIQPEALGTFRSTSLGGVSVRIPWTWCQAVPPLTAMRRPPPNLGQHNRDVYLDELGFSRSQLRQWEEAGVV